MLAAVKLISWPALSIAAVTACGRIDFGAYGDGGAAEGSVDCSPTGVTTGLVGWWKFDEASGAVAIDAAAGNDGLLLGGSSRVAGHLGGAVAFDGVTGRVDIGGTVPYATHAAAFSFSAWVNLADWSTETPDIIQIRTDGTSSPFHVLFSNNASWDGVSTGDGDGSWIPLRTDVEPSLGAWHHVAVVYNGDGALTVASFRFFLDGVGQPLEAASPYATQANQSRIGAAEDARNFWSGVIDDVRIYDRALSAGEIGELYALTCDSPTPGSAAAWSR
jgi:hypothetical protein